METVTKKGSEKEEGGGKRENKKKRQAFEKHRKLQLFPRKEGSEAIWVKNLPSCFLKWEGGIYFYSILYSLSLFVFLFYPSERVSFFLGIAWFVTRGTGQTTSMSAAGFDSHGCEWKRDGKISPHLNPVFLNLNHYNTLYLLYRLFWHVFWNGWLMRFE